ncbi:MAG: FeoB-associated Cys-rich membrane protein [Ruminococcus sp.]
MRSLISSLGIQDFIALGVILIAVIAAVYYMKKRKKNGCSGSCGDCPYSCKYNDKKDKM